MVPVRRLVASFGACTLSLQKAEKKHVFWGKNVCGRDMFRSVCCAFWCLWHYFTQQQRHYLTQHPAFEPKFDQIRDKFRWQSRLGWTSHMSAACLLLWCSVAENDLDLRYFLTRTMNATCVKSHTSKWSPSAPRHCWRRFLNALTAGPFHATETVSPLQQKSKKHYFTQHP